MNDNPLAADLDHVLAHTRGLWDELRGKRLFITGGTGFFGCWLLETFAWANRKLDLGASVTVLTRNPDAFILKSPRLATDPVVSLYQGDVRSFEFPTGQFSHIIHAAAESSAQLNTEQPLTMLDTIVQGTRHVLDFAIACKAQRLLFTSSGAVYGRQPPELTHMPEDYPSAPDTMNPGSAYGEGKRTAEFLCAAYSRKYRLPVAIARFFAIVGPHLPLGIHYAIGNFILDGLKGGPIVVEGDGTPYRSYLYMADAMIWLWTVLFRGETCRPYNVGSEEPVTVGDLARTVARLFGSDIRVEVAVAPVPGRTTERYVPSTQVARIGLGLRQSIGLEESVCRTIAWSRQADARGHCAPEQPSRP